MLIECFFDTQKQMISALLQFVQEHIGKAQEKHGNALLALSGGSSPKPLYEALAFSSVDWDSLLIALVDERWVDTWHTASNERFIRECLKVGGSEDVNFLGMKNSSASAYEGLSEANQQYNKLPRNFDLVLLGMGSDGHTASWFSEAEGLEEAFCSNEMLCAINAPKSEVSGEYTERISLTRSAVLQADNLVLMISGDEKRRVYEQSKTADCSKLPVATLLQQQDTDIHIFWHP